MAISKKIIDPALEALEEIVKKPVDLDVQAGYAASRAAALARAREAGVPDVELARRFGSRGDWGFVPLEDKLFGGKYPYSIDVTAGDIRNAAAARDPEELDRLGRIFLTKLNRLQTKDKYRPVLGFFETIAVPQSQVRSRMDLPSVKAAQAYLRTFGPAEDAGIPREWVGRVMKSIPQQMEPQNVAAPVYEQFMRKVSNHLMNLTDPQREAYLTALQRWNPRDLDGLLELVLGSVR